MKLVIEMSLDNAAFADEFGLDGNGEVGRILNDLIGRLPTPYAPIDAINLRDINGNKVGTVRIVED